MMPRSERWFGMAHRIMNRSNALGGEVQIISDVTEHKQFEQTLKESEGRFGSLAEQPLVGTYILQDDALKYVNLRFAEMFGYRPGDIINKVNLQNLIAPEDRQRIEVQVRHCSAQRQPVLHEEFRGLKRTGGTIYAEVFGSRAVYLGRPAIIGIVLDITEKKNLEQQLRQAQKMEAVGQLTSGIAHDFNNILSAIVGYASLIRTKIKPDDPAKSYAGQILSSADRAAKLIRSLLTFSRKQIADFQRIDINEIIQRAEKLIQWVMSVNIDLRVSTAARQLLVNADPGQIEQVLMNLATNAVDAMPDGGILSIETDVVSRDAVDKATAMMHQQYAVITVTDTGVGMDEKTREKIFEPFFTTKDMGRGTGLGLSIVSGIIQQHKGTIRCESQPGAGTRFRVYLPLL